MSSLIEQTLIDLEKKKKQTDYEDEAHTNHQEESENQNENLLEVKPEPVSFEEYSVQEKAHSNEAIQPLRFKQTARKRPSTQLDHIPKVQTARKHAVAGFLFEKQGKRQIKNIRKRSFQIDIYEIEVDRAEDDADDQKDPKIRKSKLFLAKIFPFKIQQFCFISALF